MTGTWICSREWKFSVFFPVKRIVFDRNGSPHDSGTVLSSILMGNVNANAFVSFSDYIACICRWKMMSVWEKQGNV